MSVLPSSPPRGASRVARRFAAVVAGVALGASAFVAAPASAAGDPIEINLLGINDFHGRIDANTVKFAGTVEQLRAGAGDAQTLVVSAGDNIGASLFPSAVQDDMPTIDVLNALDLSASAVGNHEFDRGYDDLIDRVIPAADFPILGANVFRGDDRALEASTVFDIDGVRVAVVGAVTQETPSLVTPAGIEGLTFADPVASINDAVAELEASDDPPDVYVASFHEGAPDGSETLDEAIASSAVFRNLVTNTSPEVDAIFMGHTHQQYAYDAPVGDDGDTRPVVQTGSYGSNIGQISLSVDPDSGEVTAHTQRNVARVSTDDAELISAYPRVAEVDRITQAALDNAAEVGGQPVAEITADITTAFADGRRDDRASESTLGNLVADAQLAGVANTPAGADLSVVNPGGLRSDLIFAGADDVNADGVVTFAEANAVLPFTNNLSSVSLTGAQLKSVFEQQWQRDAEGNVPSRPYLQLGTSANVRYTFDSTRDEGDRITSLLVDGQVVDPAATYKVAVPSFLASGGDNFRAFTEGTAVDTGLLDYEVWIDYLDDNSPVAPDFGRHAVQAEGLQTEYAAGDDVSFTLPSLDLTSLGSPANTSVEAFLVQGESETSLGSFPVTDGAATVSAPVPDGVSGDAQIRVEAAPSGTAATLPTITIEAASVTPTLKAVTSPFVFQGKRTVVLAKIDGSEGKGTGTVSVSSEGEQLGQASVRRGYALVFVDSRSLEPGRHTLTVSYSGDDNYAPAERDLRTYVIAKRGR